MSETIALGVYEGSDLIVVNINPELERLTGAGPVRGLPAREVWFDAASRESQELILLTMADGLPRSIDMVSTEGVPGTVFIERVPRRGRPRVVTAWAPLQGVPVEAHRSTRTQSTARVTAQ